MDNRLEPIDLLYDKPSTPTREIVQPFLSNQPFRRQADRTESRSFCAMIAHPKSVVFARLKCEDDIIYQILRKDIMEESSVYRSIFAEGATKAKRDVALSLLRESFPIEAIARGTGLSLEEVQQLQQELNVVPSV
jgi:predicted transposase YdaD